MTTAIERTVTLANGAVMPTLAFGTWQIPLNDHFKSVIRTAIDLGYRHFDTAQIYNTAKLLGEAIRESRVDRSEFFISCKLWASHRSYESAREAFEAVCTQLGFDTIDLLSVHWPAAQGEPMVWQSQNAGIWRTLEELLAEERVRAIGVANFLPHHLVPLLARAKVRPMVNQLECHPGYTQKAAVRFSFERGMLVLYVLAQPPELVRNTIMQQLDEGNIIERAMAFFEENNLDPEDLETLDVEKLTSHPYAKN